MTRLEKAIEEIKSVRKSQNRAWIFDENGVIRGDVFVGDTIDLLNMFLVNNLEVELGDYDEDAIEYNTYNWGAYISNDIAFGFKDGKMIAMVHICGDVRGNYTDLFALDIGSLDELFDYVDSVLYKDIDETHYAYFDIFNEGMEVYNSETEDSIRCFEMELGDLLQEINDKESE